jgi:hypothetical protein
MALFSARAAAKADETNTQGSKGRGVTWGLTFNIGLGALRAQRHKRALEATGRLSIVVEDA